MQSSFSRHFSIDVRKAMRLVLLFIESCYCVYSHQEVQSAYKTSLRRRNGTALNECLWSLVFVDFFFSRTNLDQIVQISNSFLCIYRHLGYFQVVLWPSAREE
jgi:hypothetical protein